MKPKYVYHGSARKLIGEKLIPKKANDLEKNPHNLLKGVYASDVKNEAIAMGIISSKGVHSSSCGVERKVNTKVDAIIYEGWPKQKYLFLYTLPSKTFQSKPKGSHQWVSLTPVKPEKIEKILISDYIFLVRKATKEEKENWNKKYGDKIK